MTDSGPDQEIVSKSERKRQANEVQALGTRLTSLSAKQLSALDLPENVFEAVELAKQIKAHGGKKRQLQLIGKLMREIDVEPIKHFFFMLDNNQNEKNSLFKQTEIYRDRLLQEGDNAIIELKNEYPALDVQKLRQLVRNGKSTKNEKLAKKAKREIFKYINEIRNIK